MSCSSRERAVMFSTVRWISFASPEMELGLMREWRALSGMEGSLSDSQMWLPSQFRARLRDGRRKGSRRSGVVSFEAGVGGRVRGAGLTFEAALEGVEV